MGVRVCLGEYAKIGYQPRFTAGTIYSIEELLFFIKENAYLLDESFMEEDLGEWICKECQLQELGEELKRASRKKITLKAYISILMDYCGFFNKDEVEEVFTIISKNSKRSITEKKKSRADAWLEKGMIKEAEREYKELLSDLPKEETVFRAQSLHGLGVCMAKLFYFERAGELFLEAYRLSQSKNSYRQYLWTKRLLVSEGEYIHFLKEHEEAYEESLEMEEIYEELKRQWKMSESGIGLSEIRRKKEEFQPAEYEKLLENKVEELKEYYLKIAE